MKERLHVEEESLEQEAHVFSRYLLDRDPSPKMIERYASANRTLLTEQALPSDRTLLRFCLTHLWAVPFLDAAAGFLRPDSLLRRKIYIMAAILETSPLFANRFLPKRTHPIALVFRLAVWGTVAAMKVVFGVPLLLLVEKGRK